MHTRTTSRAALAVGAAALLAITGCMKEGEPEPESASVLEADTRAVVGTEAADQGPPEEMYTGPRINAPQAELCPYHDEVSSSVDGPHETQAMVDKAIELGCEPDVHGGIDFEEPLFQGDDGDLMGLISVEHAMSVEDMCDAGYIPEDDCERERERERQIDEELAELDES